MKWTRTYALLIGCCVIVVGIWFAGSREKAGLGQIAQPDVAPTSIPVKKTIHLPPVSEVEYQLPHFATGRDARTFFTRHALRLVGNRLQIPEVENPKIKVDGDVVTVVFPLPKAAPGELIEPGPSFYAMVRFNRFTGKEIFIGTDSGD